VVGVNLFDLFIGVTVALLAVGVLHG